MKKLNSCLTYQSEIFSLYLSLYKHFIWTILADGHPHNTGQQRCFMTSLLRASLMAQLVKNPRAVRETWVWSLGWDSWPRDRTWVSCISRQIPYHLSHQEVHKDGNAVTKTFTVTNDAIMHIAYIIKSTARGFPGGPAAKTLHAQCRVQVHSRVRELDPTCYPGTMTREACALQQRPSTAPKKVK